MDRSKLIAFAVVGLVVVALGAAVAMPRPVTEPTPSLAPSPATVSYSGKVICLPHKDGSGPQTLECTMGLAATNGKNYGIKNTKSAFLFDVGDAVTVNGTLATPEANELYDVAGNITALEVTKN